MSFRDDLRHDRRGDKHNVDHIGRRPLGGDELELTDRNHGSTPGHLRGLYERERSQFDSLAVRALLTTSGPRLMKVDGH